MDQHTPYRLYREEILMGMPELLCTVSAVCTVAASQPLSFLRAETLLDSPCCTMVSADFNGDGRPDLAVTYSDNLDAGGRLFLVLLANSDGSMTPRATVDLGQSLILVAAVDLNGDKKADIVATSFSNGSSYVLMGNGDGTFQRPKPIGSGVLRVADFNGDGKPDLLCGGLSVRLGNGDGTFSDLIVTPAAQNFTPLAFLTPLALGDFNGDGKLDVAFTSAWHDAFGMVWVWLGNGDGMFRPQPPNDLFSQLNGASPSAPQVVAGDFNADGKLDLAIGAGSASPILGPATFTGILLGNGDGTFRKGAMVPLSAFVLITADVNGDGKPDLVSEAAVALGNGDGTFQTPLAFGFGQRAMASDGLQLTAQRQYPSIIAADFNQDGKLDLAMASRFTVTIGPSGYTSSGISVLLNDSPGPPTTVTGVSAANGTMVIAPGSIASIYGTHLAPETGTAGSLANLPTTLGGVSLHVRDAFGTDRLAQLFYVSPTQINFLVPDGTAEGLAALNIDDRHIPFVEGLRATPIQALAPAFFTADGTGTGPAAATAVRLLADGTQVPVPVFDCSSGHCKAVPIDLTKGPVYLTLYGTGFRHLSANPNGQWLAGCPIQNLFPTVTYAGDQRLIPGLDQINLLLPPQLVGAGEINLVCTFQFVSPGFQEIANSAPVKITIQ